MSDLFSTAMNHAHVQPEDTTTTTTTTPRSPTEDVEPPTGRQNKGPLRRILSILLHQWLLIGIGLVCLLAYYFPSVAKHGGLIRSEYSILYGALAVIFLISGLSIPRQKLVTHMLNWRLHILVQGTSYLIVPATVVALVHLILAGDPAGRMDRAVLAGYILTACIPTTIASNVVMTRAAGGDDAAALVEVLMGNILGPFVTPGWTVTLMPRTEEFEPWRSSSGGGGNLRQMYRDVFEQLGLSMLLPLLIGQLVRWAWPDRTAKAVQRFYLAKVATGCLLLLIWSTFSTCFATHALQSLSAETIIFTIFFNIGLYIFLTLICFLVSRPPPPPPPPRDTTTTRRRNTTILHQILTFTRISSPEETIAICFCGPAKSTAVGITLLYAMWGSGSGSGSGSSVDLYLKAKTSVPVLLYTIEQVCVAHFFVYVFARWKRGRATRRLSKGCVEGGEQRSVQDPDGRVEEEEEDEEEGTEKDGHKGSGSSRAGVVDVDDVEKGMT